MLKGYGICKDCGNGTLNNELNTQFEFDGNAAHCAKCYSYHVDGELYLTDDEDADGEDTEEVIGYGKDGHKWVRGADGIDRRTDEVDPEYVVADPYSDEAYEREVGA